MGFTSASINDRLTTLGTSGKVIRHELRQSDDYLAVTFLAPTLMSKFDSIVHESRTTVFIHENPPLYLPYTVGAGR